MFFLWCYFDNSWERTPDHNVCKTPLTWDVTQYINVAVCDKEMTETKWRIKLSHFCKQSTGAIKLIHALKLLSAHCSTTSEVPQFITSLVTCLNTFKFTMFIQELHTFCIWHALCVQCEWFYCPFTLWYQKRKTWKLSNVMLFNTVLQEKCFERIIFKYHKWFQRVIMRKQTYQGISH
jgi:hypothetical protein